ncbi:hypothetical protein ACQP2F_23660 [Actinoplanes sp. CA-030573]|uniref:hypothetical protein n=1 Tax=Actinoplanes sp. CA-030573 TaxID=3239898 RepID=UPI003D8EB0C4
MSDGEFHAYVALLAFSGLLLSVLAVRGFGQRPYSRVLDGIFAAGFLGYAAYLIVADPETVMILYYAFAAPVWLLWHMWRERTRERRKRFAAGITTQTYAPPPAPTPLTPFPPPPPPLGSLPPRDDRPEHQHQRTSYQPKPSGLPPAAAIEPTAPPAAPEPMGVTPASSGPSVLSGSSARSGPSASSGPSGVPSGPSQAPSGFGAPSGSGAPSGYPAPSGPSQAPSGPSQAPSGFGAPSGSGATRPSGLPVAVAADMPASPSPESRPGMPSGLPGRAEPWPAAAAPAPLSPAGGAPGALPPSAGPEPGAHHLAPPWARNDLDDPAPARHAEQAGHDTHGERTAVHETSTRLRQPAYLGEPTPRGRHRAADDTPPAEPPPGDWPPRH